MSQMGQKRRLGHAEPVSAYTPISDIAAASRTDAKCPKLPFHKPRRATRANWQLLLSCAMAIDTGNQRIARLTPLSDLLTLIESRVGPVTPHRFVLPDGTGGILAEDIMAAERPAHAIALRDGF